MVEEVPPRGRIVEETCLVVEECLGITEGCLWYRSMLTFAIFRFAPACSVFLNTGTTFLGVILAETGSDSAVGGRTPLESI